MILFLKPIFSFSFKILPLTSLYKELLQVWFINWHFIVILFKTLLNNSFDYFLFSCIVDCMNNFEIIIALTQNFVPLFEVFKNAYPDYASFSFLYKHCSQYISYEVNLWRQLYNILCKFLRKTSWALDLFYFWILRRVRYPEISISLIREILFSLLFFLKTLQRCSWSVRFLQFFFIFLLLHYF